MPAPVQVGSPWTVEQYLDMERRSTVKHEYHRGYVYAMAGGTQSHSVIAVNIGTLLRNAVRGSRCRLLNSDIKIRQSPNDYVYADAVVAFDPRDEKPDQEWIDHPTLVVEVLSKSTERHDRTDKFDGYKGIATLREYVLIEYERRALEVWRRDDGGSWSSRTYGPGGAVALASVDLMLTLDQIYEDSGI